MIPPQLALKTHKRSQIQQVVMPVVMPKPRFFGQLIDQFAPGASAQLSFKPKFLKR